MGQLKEAMDRLASIPRRTRQVDAIRHVETTVVQVNPAVLTDIVEQLERIEAKLDGRGPLRKRGLSVKEAAALLGIDGQILYKLVKQGQLPHFWIGRLLRFPEDIVDQLVRVTNEGGQT